MLTTFVNTSIPLKVSLIRDIPSNINELTNLREIQASRKLVFWLCCAAEPSEFIKQGHASFLWR